MPKVFNLLSYDIAEYIEKYIQVHQLKPGDRLPTERELSDQLSITRVSVRQGYQRLLDQGIIYSSNGYYVNHPKYNRSMILFPFPYADTFLKGVEYSVKTTEYMPDAVHNICYNMLNADKDAHLSQTRFIEYLSDIPVSITFNAQTSSSMADFPGLFYAGAIPGVLKQTQHLRIHPPSEEEIKLLSLSEYDSMMMLVNRFQYQDIPMAVSISLCVGTRLNLLSSITV